ncbi:hypothetical protein EON81_10395 [bacterium]|nr:MAG: hypothetical protein EON81_10395 [bacterium]
MNSSSPLLVRYIIQDWSDEDRTNLWHLLTAEKELRAASTEEIANKINELYNHIVRETTEVVVRNTWEVARSRFNKEKFRAVSLADVQKQPSYEELVQEACSQLKIREDEATLEEWELFLSQQIILMALQRMSPRKRADELNKSIDASKLATSAGAGKVNLNGPISLLSVFTLGSASGFGIYLASTTALGFLTGVLGITLPFAVYTGLTTALSIFLTPWTAVAGVFWLGYKFTGPKWKVLIPAILYISSVRHREGA